MLCVWEREIIRNDYDFTIVWFASAANGSVDCGDIDEVRSRFTQEIVESLLCKNNTD